MVFSTLTFLYYFLPAALILYFISPSKLKNTALLIASLVFYAWGEPKYIILMITSILIGYASGLLIERFREKKKTARAVLIASTALSLGALGYFKYSGFFVENLNALTGLDFTFKKVALPVGISFYTFQILSYVVDVYRKDVKAQRNPIDLGAYVSMFPQLIAGPIVRYSDVDDALRQRAHSFVNAAKGVRRFVCGLAKKVLLANTAGAMYELMTETVSSTPNFVAAWLGIVFFAFQIYFDFSGYSDMAIGIALILGYRFMDNFDSPFKSQNPTEFWRRWHISLSSWLRDYLYIPMGGSRSGRLRSRLNLLNTMVIGGLWHGASWMFLIWGAWNGLLLILHKELKAIFTFKLFYNSFKNTRKVFNIIITFTLISFGMIFFRAGSMEQVNDMLTQIFSNFHLSVAPQFISGYTMITLTIIVALVLHFSPHKWTISLQEKYIKMPTLIQGIVLAAVIFLIIQVRQSDIVPFIYLQY